MMRLHRIIVHEVKKEQMESNVVLDLSSELLPANGIAMDMLIELDKRYSTLSHTYASFDPTPNNNFPILFKEYLSNIDNKTFIDFSVNTVRILEQTIKLALQSKGGYLIFVEYENRHHHMAVFLLRNKKFKVLSKNPTSQVFNLSETLSLDVDNLAMAGRININNVNDGPGVRYITFINKRNEDSQYFLNWFCAVDKHNNREDTKVLREIIKTIDLPKNENGIDSMDREEFIKSIIKHIKSSPNKVVDLRLIGLAFYDDAETLIRYSEEHSKIINHEFKVHLDELKKLHTIQTSADSITLNFPADYFRENKIVLNEKDGYIIIKSSNLLEKVKMEKAAFELELNE